MALKIVKPCNSHGVSESVYNWIQVIVEVYYKEMLKKFTDTKNDTFTKHSADYSLVHNMLMDKKYVEKFVHKDDIVLKMADKWNIKFNLYGQLDVTDYPIEMSANVVMDDKAVNLIVNCNFNETDWRAILTNEDFLDELEDTLAYEFTKLIEKLNLKKSKKKVYHQGYQLNAVKNYLKMGVVGDTDYEMIYFLSCIGLSTKHEINARVNQYFQEIERNDIDTTSKFEDMWKKSNHYKIYEALCNFNATEVYAELVNIHGEDYLKDIILQWDQYAESNEELVNVRIDKKHIDNPLEFIKYWGEIFKNSAEYYRRKCMKLYSAHFSMEDIQEKRDKERKDKPVTPTYQNHWGEH